MSSGSEDGRISFIARSIAPFLSGSGTNSQEDAYYASQRSRDVATFLEDTR
jgi:hypothetical protein